jgi:dTMP kinase
LHFFRYGGERYEKRELQLRVRQRFAQLQAQDERLQTVPWHVVDAAQSIEEVQKEINTIVLQTVESVQEQQQKGKPMPTMWNHVLGDTSTGAEEKEKGK